MSTTAPAPAPTSKRPRPSAPEAQVRFAVICASNQNRSMEAHSCLLRKSLNVSSFGTGSMVRLPGPSIDKPNVYRFGTPYNTMYTDLYHKDLGLYTQNGILNMLDRNRKIKRAPEKFQESRREFDIIICCEERVWDAVIEDLSNRTTVNPFRPVHVFNLDIRDNHEDATIGARKIADLAEQMIRLPDIDEVEPLIHEFCRRENMIVLHSVHYY